MDTTLTSECNYWLNRASALRWRVCFGNNILSITTTLHTTHICCVLVRAIHRPEQCGTGRAGLLFMTVNVRIVGRTTTTTRFRTCSKAHTHSHMRMANGYDLDSTQAHTHRHTFASPLPHSHTGMRELVCLCRIRREVSTGARMRHECPYLLIARCAGEFPSGEICARVGFVAENDSLNWATARDGRAAQHSSIERSVDSYFILNTH